MSQQQQQSTHDSGEQPPEKQPTHHKSTHAVSLDRFSSYYRPCNAADMDGKTKIQLPALQNGHLPSLEQALGPEAPDQPSAVPQPSIERLVRQLHPLEQILYQQPQKAQPAAPSAIGQSDVTLLLHLCHLMNAALSLLTAYLSFEALVRKADEGDLPPCFGIENGYRVNMNTQAGMIHDACNNVGTILRYLFQTSLHQKIEEQSSYRSLIDGAFTLRNTVCADLTCMVPLGSTSMKSLVPAEEACARLRAGRDHLVALCQGDAARRVDGWKACWKAVEEALKQAEA